MSEEDETSERIREVLTPYASNWTGTLGRGDLVIPQRDIPRLIHDILEVLAEDAAPEAGEREVFDVLMAASRHESVQEQAAILRRKFRLLTR